ncbi:thiolase-like protein [Mycena albidolilacea]|uniref:Thiolase-like protein n=1 Tax=Mycena albidolilacea TaxID=1033008 RepID=A0AAD7EI25_9AGAR|nr:thiolase-like protein [Mycena albidolilacea]
MELEGIAIVGLAAQLPSGPLSSTDFDYASFWDFLVTSGKAYEPLENVLPDFVRASTFDNISLGISTKDVRMTPYCARRLLDLSFQALLDSGIDSWRHNIGCFMSGNRPGHMNAPGALEKGIDAEGSLSGTPYLMANRISYALDLTGPSLQLDAACSSSLTALHLAATAIRQGDCEAALVGAAQINRELSEWTTYVQGSILVADGMSGPLDAEAAGFGCGEAAVVVVLKPLKDVI